MKTDVLVSAKEAVQSKESIPLSLVDDVGEIVVQDSIPDEVTPNVTVENEGEIGGMDDLKISTSDISIHG